MHVASMPGEVELVIVVDRVGLSNARDGACTVSAEPKQGFVCRLQGPVSELAALGCRSTSKSAEAQEDAVAQLYLLLRSAAVTLA